MGRCDVDSGRCDFDSIKATSDVLDDMTEEQITAVISGLKQNGFEITSILNNTNLRRANATARGLLLRALNNVATPTQLRLDVREYMEKGSIPLALALTFSEVSVLSISRGNRWHKGGIETWSIADWAVAMAGEAGEVCNAVKKLRRVEDELANLNEPGRQLSTRNEAVAKIGEECADVLLYLFLVVARLKIDLASEVIKKFNSVSEKYGFPERIT